MCSKGHRYTPASPRARCPVCERARNKERYQSDPDRRALSTYRWRQVRKLAAERDGNRCRFQGPDCYGRLEAHHIVAIKHGRRALRPRQHRDHVQAPSLPARARDADPAQGRGGFFRDAASRTRASSSRGKRTSG